MTAALEFLANLVMGAFGLTMLILISLADRIQRKKDVPVPLRSTGPSAEESERPALPAGYVEPKRTFELREAYVVRRATKEESVAAANAAMDKLKVRALIRDAGGC